MNLKNNKGYTAVDASVAIIICMLFIPTIFGMTYNIKKTEAGSTKKSYATELATEVLSAVKLVKYEDIDKGFTVAEEQTLDEQEENLDEESKKNTFLKQIKSKFDGAAEANTTIFGEENNNSKYRYFSKNGDNGEIYQVQVVVMNYYPENDNSNQDIIKKVKVVVAYSVGSKIEKVELFFATENEEYSRKELLS